MGVLFSPLWVVEPQAGVLPAGGVEQVDQAIVPSGVLGWPLFGTAVVELLIGVLVQALPHRCLPWVVVVRKGVVGPVVFLTGRRVWHRQAARVAVPQLGDTQRDDIVRGGLQLDVGRPGALDGVVEPHCQSSHCSGHAKDPVARRRGCTLGDGIVNLGANAMRSGDSPENPGDLGAHRSRACARGLPPCAGTVLAPA